MCFNFGYCSTTTDDQTDLRNPMKSAAKFIIIFLILALLAFFAWQYFKPKNQQPEYISADVVMSDLESSVLATGKLQASRTVNVGAQVSGQVTEMYVKLGDQVKQGDLIARIDSVTQQNTLKTAQANIQNQQAQRQSRLIAIEKAQADYQRHATLYKDNAVSKAELDAASATLKTAQADLKALDAQLEQSQLSLATAKQNLSYTAITAPISGTVVSIVTEQGQTVNANQTAPTIVKLAQLENMTIKASISEADVMKIHAGQDVYFTTLGSDKKYYAKLRQVEPAPSTDSSSNSAIYYNALFDVPNHDGQLRIDMTAQVTIILQQVKNALTIPASALQSDTAQNMAKNPATKPTNQTTTNNGNADNTRPANSLQLTQDEQNAIQNGTAKLHFVRVLQSDGTTQRKQILIGLNNRVQAQVLKGLQQGEKVVIADASDNSNNSAKRNNAPPRM